MPTEIENDSPLLPLAFLGVGLLVLLAGAVELAYLGGVFTWKNDVITNDKRIANEASLKSAGH